MSFKSRNLLKISWSEASSRFNACLITLSLYLKKHKISSIYNKISIIVDKEPKEVGIDPYNKLIDTNSEDNRKKIEN